MVEQLAAKPAADERADTDGQKGEAHVGTLLPGRSQAGDVFVVARGLDNLAGGNNGERRDRGPLAVPEEQREPSDGGDKGAQRHGGETRYLTRGSVDGDGEEDDDDG